VGAPILRPSALVVPATKWEFLAVTHRSQSFRTQSAFKQVLSSRE
ncbi:uncharacterized protein METZ01_LOCUS392421, partial [marine metagenome]